MVKKLFNNKLLRGSFILFAGASVVNLGNYLYHFLMGRLLGPNDYGILVSLISLVYITSVASLTLDTVVVKFTSTFKAKKQFGQIFSIFKEFNQRFVLLGMVVFVIFALASRSIAGFLNIKADYRIIILLSSTFLIRFLVPINNGLLRSFFKFPFLSVNGILAVVIKLGAGLIFVKAGLSVFGAAIGIVLADFMTYFISFLPLRFLWSYKEKLMKFDWRGVIAYTGPAFVTVFSLTSLYTTDIILVKHFFNPHQAGLYSALAMMGKIVFFASGSVPAVMFPLVVQSYENGKKYRDILTQSLLMVGLVSVGITIIYFLVPKLMIQILYGSSYLEMARFLGFFAIFISLYSLASVLANFFLSIHRTKVSLLVFLAALSQVILIWFYHISILQVIRISIVISALLLFSLLLFFLKNEKT